MLLKALEIHGFKSFPDKTVLDLRPGNYRGGGPQRQRKIQHKRRHPLGAGGTVHQKPAGRQDGGRHLQRHRPPPGRRLRRGVPGHRQHRPAAGFRRRRREGRPAGITVRGTASTCSTTPPSGSRTCNCLFMDTGLGRDGYSIVGQGRIADIVASKSEERREIFEEAAGISKYRFRKNEAERRLKATEENLLRLRDILQGAGGAGRAAPAAGGQRPRSTWNYAGEKKELEIGLWLHTAGAVPGRAARS